MRRRERWDEGQKGFAGGIEKKNKNSGRPRSGGEDWEWSVSGTGQEIKAEINIYILFLNNGSVHSLHFQPASSLIQPSIVVGTFSSQHLFNLR